MQEPLSRSNVAKQLPDGLRPIKRLLRCNRNDRVIAINQDLPGVENSRFAVTMGNV